ncbi:MAG: DEAD/DEAH box helicase [Gemmatimonadota bacterium]
MSLPQSISSSPRARRRSSRVWLEKVPIIVAESLEAVSDPLLPVLRPGRWAQAPAVAAAIRQALARPEDPRPLPEWLLDHQRPLVRYLLPMLSRYGGALLAAPVGSGKTYIALATAALSSRAPAIALVPAALVSQWRRTAAKLQIEIMTCSHERLSRGRLPEPLLQPSRDRRLVIIDESHHFRNPSSLRYRHLAPALVGRPVLLLSATPVVNRLSDLAHQLLLGIRDDALGPFGVQSLREHFATARDAHPAVATLILTSPDDLRGKPRRHDRRAGVVGNDGEQNATCAAIDSLVLSRNPAIAGLIRIVLWRAQASSPAALAGALRRYRGLLLHAGEALASGRTLDRAALRRVIGSAPDQLLMWELLSEPAESTDLDLGDLGAIETLLEQSRTRARFPDAKCRGLRDELANGKRTIVFTVARETVQYLREHLRDNSMAWCTGEAAGIGHTHLSRDAVLHWFEPGSSNGGGPRVLITTDVAAEGLDLQRAERVVHYDLPWTAVRLDQRDGRALRLGSEHAKIEVIRFDPPAALAERLKQVSILARKRALPRRAGLTGTTARNLEWRDRLAGTADGRGDRDSWAAVEGEPGGVLAGFTILVSEPGGCRDLASVIGWLDEAGSWSEQPEVIERALRTMKSSTQLPEPGPGMLDHALRLLGPMVRERLETTRAARWARPVIGSAAARLIERLNRLSIAAARARDSARLTLLERALHFVGRGHTAGEEHWIQVLGGLPDPLLYQQLQRCPSPGADPLPRVRLNGLIVFMPGARAAVKLSSSAPRAGAAFP